jgi:hypothetical protein
VPFASHRAGLGLTTNNVLPYIPDPPEINKGDAIVESCPDFDKYAAVNFAWVTSYKCVYFLYVAAVFIREFADHNDVAECMWNEGIVIGSDCWQTSFRNWFGGYADWKLDFVINVLDSIIVGYHSATRVVCGGSDCDGADAYAQIGLWTEEVHLCDSFFSQNWEEQIITIIHEMGHIAGLGHPTCDSVSVADRKEPQICEVAEWAEACSFDAMTEPETYGMAAIALGAGISLAALEWPDCVLPNIPGGGGTITECGWDSFHDAPVCLSSEGIYDI